MIIFDGSGSMWGKPLGEKQSKLALARDALRQSLPRLAKQARVGLMVFGHRRPGDCADVELVTRPTPVDLSRIIGPLEKLNPKGKGPLALAIGEAAHVLGAAEAGNVVLIHDDIDNCAHDPCTAIAEISRIYPRLTVHVVSIGLQHEDARRMACFARTTGGKMFEAQTAAEILTAVGEALSAGSTVAGTPVPQPKLASRDSRPSANVAPLPTKPGLYLTTSLTANAEPLDIPVRWRVTSKSDADGLAAFQQEAATPHLVLPAGRYEVEARLPQVSARQIVEVDPATTQRVNLVLTAGTIRVTATAQRGTAIAGSLLTISRPESSMSGVTTSRPGEAILVSNALQSEIALTPGPYVISISHGLFRTDRQIMVVAGTRGRLGITLPTGEIELQATAGGGGPPLADVVFQVFEDDPDAPQGRRELMRSAASRPSFSLPAGTYYVVARHGSVEARERLTVRPGEVERRTLTISSAQLSLAATIAGGRPDSSDSIVYRIERIDTAPQSEVMRVTRQAETLNLAPGRYRVESRLGSLNARAERTIDLRTGVREDLTLDHQAGVVRLTFVEAGSTQPAADVFWEIKDQSGQTVWLTSEPQPLGILRAGRYTVRAQYRDRVVDGRIEVQAGDNRVVELIAR
jgi:Ca-activated chloride channel family protein